MHGLLLGADTKVASWAFNYYQRVPVPYQRAIGILNSSGSLVGCALFENYNGCNVELSYYGERTLTLGITRALARLAIAQFNPSRATVLIPKSDRSLARALTKPALGFKLEGAQRCFYGAQDSIKNTALRFVIFRDQIEKIAKGHETRITGQKKVP